MATKAKSVYQLREKYSDYTILRKLCEVLKAGPASKLVKQHGSAYKAARILLERAQRNGISINL